MSTADRVTNAQNLPEAMLAIAEGIDELRTLLTQQPAQAAFDPWATWPAFNAPGAPTPLVEPDGQEIAAVREQLANEHDGEERRALEARLRLLTDDGAPMGRNHVPEGQRTAIQVGEKEIIVDLPPADPERQAQRRAWALTHKVGSSFYDMDDESFAAAYAKGGPMYAYLGDREAVMQMPLAWRQLMVMDVEADSPAQAQELARDILKSEDSVAQDTAIDAIQRMSESGGA